MEQQWRKQSFGKETSCAQQTSSHEQKNSIFLSSPDHCWIFPHEREKVFGTTRIHADNNNHLHTNKKILSAKVLPLFSRSFPNFSPLCLMIVSSLPTSISPSFKPSSSVAYNLCYLLPLLNDNITEKNFINISFSPSLSLSNVTTFRHLAHQRLSSYPACIIPSPSHTNKPQFFHVFVVCFCSFLSVICNVTLRECTKTLFSDLLFLFFICYRRAGGGLNFGIGF